MWAAQAFRRAVAGVVLNAEQAEDVVFGEHGLVHSLPAEAVIVSATTVSPGRRGHWLHARSGPNALAVRSGERRTLHAAEGTLTSMVGGDTNDDERARNTFGACGNQIQVVCDLDAR
jgi:3-hydroxyisobutyrate dehydrogenase-like beta-hydroxyacid dehydrogenase